MARKGDIDSKSVSSRVPMEVFLKLQRQAFDKKQTMSAYLCDILSDEKFGKGGDIVNVRVPIKDPILINENQTLKNRNLELENHLLQHGNFILKIIHIEEVKKELENTNLPSITTGISELKNSLKKQMKKP